MNNASLCRVRPTTSVAEQQAEKMESSKLQDYLFDLTMLSSKDVKIVLVVQIFTVSQFLQF